MSSAQLTGRLVRVISPPATPERCARYSRAQATSYEILLDVSVQFHLATFWETDRSWKWQRLSGVSISMKFTGSRMTTPKNRRSLKALSPASGHSPNGKGGSPSSRKPRKTWLVTAGVVFGQPAQPRSVSAAQEGRNRRTARPLELDRGRHASARATRGRSASQASCVSRPVSAAIGRPEAHYKQEIPQATVTDALVGIQRGRIRRRQQSYSAADGQFRQSNGFRCPRLLDVAEFRRGQRCFDQGT